MRQLHRILALPLTLLILASGCATHGRYAARSTEDLVFVSLPPTCDRIESLLHETVRVTLEDGITEVGVLTRAECSDPAESFLVIHTSEPTERRIQVPIDELAIFEVLLPKVRPDRVTTADAGLIVSGIVIAAGFYLLAAGYFLGGVGAN